MTNFINMLEQNEIPFLLDEPLSRHTTFKIGGNAGLFVEPSSPEETGEVIKLLRKSELDFLVLGRGSNVLFSDEGYNGVIVHLGKNMANIMLVGKDTICAESGASLSDMCMFALEQGLEGMEPLYGIPGSVGGAAYMNAGAYGGEVKDVAMSISHVDTDGNLAVFKDEEMGLSYRHSSYTDNGFVITGLTVKLKKGDRNEIRARMDDFMNRRRTKQPLEYPSAGSTFKRPVGGYASALIDECGLKGTSVGGAEVSTKHAGFIVNRGGATCADVLELIDKVREVVAKQKGINLECEIKLIEP